MSKRESIIRLSLILRKLKIKSSSFQEVYDFLIDQGQLLSYNFDISKRTFQRDLEDIASIFGIEIVYDFKRMVYFIDEESPANDRLIEAFDIFSAINALERIPDELIFEDRKPLGVDNLLDILNAIKNQQLIQFNYQKFYDDNISSREVAPYALKEFKHRWYLVGMDQKDEQIKLFGLDRFSDFKKLAVKFVTSDFNVKEYFHHCYGITRPNEKDVKPEKVVLSFSTHKGKYIKSLPLHHTQEIIADNDLETRIQLEVYLTYDFKMELLSHGEHVKVLAPKRLKDELINDMRNTLSAYS